MKTYWTFTKASLAVVSIGILLTPLLRELGYLPSKAAVDDLLGLSDGEAGSRMVAPPELSSAGHSNGEFSFPRH